MTPTQAAKIIGCTPGQVRTLVRAGKIGATKTKQPGGYYYEITPQEVKRYSKIVNGGWPRGKKRKGTK